MRQFCNKKGHAANTCRKLGRLLNASGSSSSGPFTGYYANSQSATSSPSWIVDSGATAHVTATNQHMQNSSPYTGFDSLQVGNGNCLPISHTGFTRIHTPSAVFTLKDVLHVPSIKHNLL